MQRVVALDCYGRDKNGINGLIRNINTALIATTEIGLKRTSVIALLLYRPVLKKVITLEEVEKTFDADVTLIIQRLLKTSDLYARNTAVNSENFHHLLFSFAEDVRVILIMIADRLCLMRLGKQLKEDDRPAASHRGLISVCSPGSSPGSIQNKERTRRLVAEVYRSQTV